MLSEAELRVARLISYGVQQKEAAFRLGISKATLTRHTFNIYQKIGAESNIDLCIWMVRNGLVNYLDPADAPSEA